MKRGTKKSPKECQSAMRSVRDALDVLNGKWKLLILISIIEGHKRFKEIERSIPNISAKVLAKELKDLEAHQLVARVVYDQTPVLIEYIATAYVDTLGSVISELEKWGGNHRQKIMGTPLVAN